MDDLSTFYNSNKEQLTLDSEVFSSSPKIKTIYDLLQLFVNTSEHQESHNLWRCNHLKCASLLKEVIKRPKPFPKFGTSLERFISIDSGRAPSYQLPNSECSNMFVHQLQGTRRILLIPTADCRSKKHCYRLSIVLPKNHARELPKFLLVFDASTLFVLFLYSFLQLVVLQTHLTSHF